MRTKFRKGGFDSTLELCVRPSRGEACDVQLARELKQSSMPFLVRLLYDVGRKRDDVTFRYDLEGMRSLRTVLRGDPVTAALVIGVLKQLVNMLDWRGSCLARECYVSFLPEHVFMDERGNVRFLVVPLRGVRARARDSPIALLWALSDSRHVNYASADDRVFAERLREFAIGEEGTLSQMRLREFLREVSARQGMVPAKGAGRGLVLRSASDGRAWDLAEGRRYAMGRDANCDIRLCGTPTVSRKHAMVWCENDTVLVTDQKSTNGTFVDGRRLSPGQTARLRVGQSFGLANEAFLVERG